jgi:hypothetical protein
MTINSKPVEAIPEVAAFARVQQELDEFKRANPEFFDQLQGLVDRYNAARDMAEQAVRTKQVSCGPFQLTGRPSISWKWETLYEEMGRDWFTANVSGRTVTTVTYEGDKGQAEALYAAGIIPGEVSDKARAVKVSYHKPAKVELP